MQPKLYDNEMLGYPWWGLNDSEPFPTSRTMSQPVHVECSWFHRGAWCNRFWRWLTIWAGILTLYTNIIKYDQICTRRNNIFFFIHRPACHIILRHSMTQPTDLQLIAVLRAQLFPVFLSGRDPFWFRIRSGIHCLKRLDPLWFTCQNWPRRRSFTAET